ncbi:MAG TPA: hypothetical protein VI685_05810 [Candidatus Angelobacter sp.]
MHKTALIFLATVSAFCVTARSSNEFVPQSYGLSDGALVLESNGNYVEPYFATKALIVAQDAGLDVRQPARAWIEWALAHQRSDGRFERFCRKPEENWKSCGAADADDSMLALWLQLLYRFAPDSGIPAPWQESVRKARSQLAKLRNGRLEVYHVSERNHVALLMDNVEIYSALKDMATAQRRFGDNGGADATGHEAETLASGIRNVFWDERNQWFRPSMQKNKPAFYPDVVAQVFPWLAGLPGSVDPRAAWENWKSRFASGWLESKYDPHPWGLVALAAAKEGDESSAVCWLSRSQSLRYSSRWNVLEEAVYQGLEHRLGEQQLADATACSRVLAR